MKQTNIRVGVRLELMFETVQVIEILGMVFIESQQENIIAITLKLMSEHDNSDIFEMSFTLDVLESLIIEE